MEVQYPIYILIFIAIIISILIIVHGLSTKCPKCKKWWAGKSIDSYEMGREDDYKTVTKYDIARDADGKEATRTERKEQIHVTKVKYKNHYLCKYCKHEWVIILTNESEG
jgi:hypothetical protein